MPEGPSIVILRQLAEPFAGKKVEHAGGIADIDMGRLQGQTINEFKSFGKNFFICFKGFSVRIHLMMFGSYSINEHKERKAKLSLQFDDGELNFYTCIVQMIDEPLNELYDFTADIMNPHFSEAKALKKLQAHPKMQACDALMDQDIFAGVGNIIKNEVLFRIRVHPKSLLGDMPAKKLKEMIAEARTYGHEFLKWKKANELKKHWLAYHQKMCPRDQVPFIKADTGKGHRASFYCEVCQKKYANE